MPKNSASKPKKPYLEFPLTPHPRGQWCKKIRGKLHYFGSWSDPQGALKEYLLIQDDLQGDRNPKFPDSLRFPDSYPVQDLCNLYLESQKRLVD
ncbi:MAG: hypothetical protein KC931_26545 [Candidatus Omnitrophica bacterium]|nr:hypothetical protein [Candidatus Omnitrophota bacterium]